MTANLDYGCKEGKELFKALKLSVNKPSMDSAARKYNKQPKELRGLWEGYNLLLYANHVLRACSIDTNKIEEILSGNGINGIQEGIKKIPGDKGVGPGKLNSYFLSLAEIQNISLSDCLCNFFEFCINENLPLSGLLPNINKDAIPSLSDVEKARIYVKNCVTEIRKNTKNSLRSSAGSSSIKLEIPSQRENNPNYFGSKIIDVLGRDKEQEILREFLKHDKDRRFLWFQLAGVAGQGKSRLALELALEAEEQGWISGFVPTKEEKLKGIVDQLKQWSPDKPHLFIVDYVIGRNTEGLQSFFQILLDRRNEFQQEVRLLLLERQPWNRDFQRSSKAGASDKKNSSPINPSHAQWFLDLINSDDGHDPEVADTRFDTGVLELRRLEADALLDIVKLVGKDVSKDKINFAEKISDADIKQQLERIDKEGRPLYAYFLAQELAHGSKTRGWSRDDLLTAALTREQKKWWAASFEGKPPGTEDDIPALRLALLATMTDGVDCLEAHSRNLIPFVERNIRKQALALTGGLLDEEDINGPTDNISALQPDLLGEWFVISCFKKGRISLKEMNSIAWQYAPQKMSSFMLRVCQDFWGCPIVKDMLDRIDVEKVDLNALSKISKNLVLFFMKNKYQIPGIIVKALEIDAKYSPASMLSLGLCYANGWSGEKNPSRAFELFRQVADLGNEYAINFLGECYARGIGTEKNPNLAFHYFEKAAAAKFVNAMFSLGICYLAGEGTEKNPKLAFEWLKSAADMGHTVATVKVGVCYIEAIGTDKNEKRGFEFLQKTASDGNSEAMFYLSLCYDLGKGIDRDEKRAVDLLQKSADAGYTQAMVNLAGCYMEGRVVKKDPEKAIYWMTKAMKGGHPNLLAPNSSA